MNPKAIEKFYRCCGRDFAKFHPKGCWIWRGAKGSGYGTCENHIATHLSWEIAHGSPPPLGLGVLHKCDIPLCVNPDHLFIGTSADNVRDMIAKGRQHKEVGAIAREANRKMRDAGFLTLKAAASLAKVATAALHYSFKDRFQIINMLGAKYVRRVDVEAWIETPNAERARWRHAGLCPECGSPRGIGPYGPNSFCNACELRIFPYLCETAEGEAVVEDAAVAKLKGAG